MNSHENTNNLELDIVTNTYTTLVATLVEAGWEQYGENQERWLNYPYDAFGAQRFFMKDGKLHLVSIALNIRQHAGLTDLINVSEYNLIDKHDTDFEAIEVASLLSNFADWLIDDYKEYQAVELSMMDDDDNMMYFMRHEGDGRALYESRSDEDRLRPLHQTHHLIPIADCQYEVEPLAT